MFCDFDGFSSVSMNSKKRQNLPFFPIHAPGDLQQAWRVFVDSLVLLLKCTLTADSPKILFRAKIITDVLSTK